MKTCVDCCEIKDESQFSFKSKQRGTLQPRCKMCYNAYNRRYYADGEKDNQLRRTRANTKKWSDTFRKWKQTLACSSCDEDNWVCLDLHHRDPSQKDFTLSQSLTRRGPRQVREEVAKCIVLCANCHRKAHAGMLNTTDLPSAPPLVF